MRSAPETPGRSSQSRCWYGEGLQDTSPYQHHLAITAIPFLRAAVLPGVAERNMIMTTAPGEVALKLRHASLDSLKE